MVKKKMFLVMCLCLMGVLASVGQAIPDPVAFWALDDGAGSTAVDSSGNGYDGTVGGDAVWVAGQYGGALEFAGSGWVDLPPAAWNDNIFEGFTICLWYTGSNTNNSAGRVADASGTKYFSIHMPWANGILFDKIGTARLVIRPAGELGEWAHYAFVYTAGRKEVYRNGEVIGNQAVTGDAIEQNCTDFVFGNNPDRGSGGAIGTMDDLRLYDVALTEEEVLETMDELKVSRRGPAAGLSPSDSATDVLRDTVLTWEPGEFAESHKVYFGDSFEDVNTATEASDVYRGEYPLADTSYDPGRMEFGTTYFWRIDEVNDAHPDKLWKGDVWQFEVEPEGILVTQLTPTASSQNSADEDPNNTINGAGLNPDGSHSQDKTTMWLSAISDPNTAWIRYDLSAPQKLVEMLVWNHNTQSEEDIGYGIKEALIEVSVDGNDFTSLGTVELAKAAETTVALQGIVAQSVKITALSNWGGIFDKFGLSEVRLYAMPMVARELSPADGAADVDPKTAVLTWRAGREADVHNVYLSTDEQAVIDGTAPVLTLPEALYAPDLALDTTNYWRVDEVNDLEDPNVWVRSVQSFSTTAYIVVDDMESYSVYVGEEFFATWEDGYEKPANGALVGHGFYAEPETQIVHDGAQSMPLYYGEDGASVSETTRPFAPAEDWSKYGIQSLSLYFYGSADNTGGQLYVKINNGTPHNYQGAATDIQTAQWFPFTIDLTGVTVVNSLTIGVTGGSGMVIIDDIRLYSQTSELITPVAPDAANLQVNYLFEGNFNDSSGNGYDGTATGDPAFVTDPERGQVLSFDGVDDDVDVPLVSVSDEVTIAMWMSIPDLDNFKSAFMSNGWEPNAVHTRLAAGKVEIGINGVDAATGTSVVDVNEWVYVSFTVKNTATETIATVYLNGIAEGSFTAAVDSEVGPRTVWVGNGKIGAWTNTAGNTIRRTTGMIDDVVIYDRALSAAEIAGLAERSAPLYKAFPQ